MAIGLINYGVKYRLEYQSRGNYATRIDIKFKDYTGSIIELIGSESPFELVYESNDENPFDTLKSSYATINVKRTSAIINDFIEIEDENNIILEYSRNGNLIWSGYILQEQYQEGDDNNNPFISLKFYDAISRLRIYTIEDLPQLSANEISLYELFYAISFNLFAFIDEDTDVLFFDFVRHNQSISNYFLNVVHINKDSLFDNSNNPLNLYDILIRIGQTFNFTFANYKNKLLVYNFSYLKNPVVYNFFTSTASTISNNKTIDSNHYWIDKSKLITFWDSLKKIEVFHRYDQDPSYLSSNNFNNIEVLSPFTSANNPLNDDGVIIFNSFADEPVTRTDPDPNKSYKDVSIFTDKINIDNPFNDFNRKYRLKYKIRFEFDYGITDTEFNSLTTSEKIQLEEDIKEIEANTEIRFYYQINTIVGGTTYYLNTGRNGNYTYTTFPAYIEVNGTSGIDSLGIDQLISGYDYVIDIPLKNGENQLEIKFFHPYVYTDSSLLSSSNTRSIEGVNVFISDIEFLNIDRIGIEEERYEGRTDRNVFNYNLNRDQEYFYTDIDESKYTYTLVNSSGNSIGKGINRRTVDYTAFRNEDLRIYEYLINQNLNQFGRQQQYITGNLKVINDTGFDILSVVNIDSKEFGIDKFNYNDKQGVYQIELIEIRNEL
jgi:hypothetical protein